MEIIDRTKEENKTGEHIKLVRHIYGNENDEAMCDSNYSAFEKIELLERNYNGLDIILVSYDETDKLLYLGHWNDGTVKKQ